MKILITGGCGFVGSNLSIFLKKKGFKVSTLDNLYRLGSKLNLNRIQSNKIKNYKLDIVDLKKILKLPKFDLIIDCCAEASVEASRKSLNEGKRVFDTNLIGTFNILQKCLLDKSKIIFLSTSRVYSINGIKKILPKFSKIISKKINSNFEINLSQDTKEAKSLYGFTKIASEDLIKEYAYSNNLKYLINRFGVIAGPWQFGKVDQGFMSLWVWRHLSKINLKYIGFGGFGNQIRDVLHIDDLCDLILMQIKKFSTINNKSFTAGGGKKNKISLKDLTFKVENLTNNKIKFKKIKQTSIYDIPYFVTSNKEVNKYYKWKPKKNVDDIIIDIYSWQKKNFKILKKYF